MKRVILLRFAGRDLHIPKLVGALILAAAVLMFFKASADMYDSWDHLKAVETCMESVGVCNPNPDPNLSAWEVSDPCTTDEWQVDYDTCRADLYNSTGVTLRTGQRSLTTRQFWSALLQPIAMFFFWMAIVFFGWMIYNTGRLTLPIEETIMKIKEKEKKE